MFFRRMLDDERAADALPMRMVVAVIALAALLILLSSGISSLLEDEESYAAEGIISGIESHAEQMSSKGAGSVITMDVYVPSNTKIVLGAIPGQEANWPDDAQNYYVEINGRQTIGESGALYSNSLQNGCFILYPGSYALTMESVRDQNGNIFIILSN